MLSQFHCSTCSHKRVRIPRKCIGFLFDRIVTEDTSSTQLALYGCVWLESEVEWNGSMPSLLFSSKDGSVLFPCLIEGTEPDSRSVNPVNCGTSMLHKYALPHLFVLLCYRFLVPASVGSLVSALARYQPSCARPPLLLGPRPSLASRARPSPLIALLPPWREIESKVGERNGENAVKKRWTRSAFL